MSSPSTVTVAVVTVALLIAVPGATAEEKPQTQTGRAAGEQAKEPDHIKVQHILIGFQGSMQGKEVSRTSEEARKLAYELLERARKGEDFGELVKQYSDDQYPGIYGMANNEVQPGPGEYPRGRMVRAFGDVGFPLGVGEIGIADYDPQKSKYGWHIIKRVE